jgi:uncharacterized protein YndB with AHSA1/START domain
MAERFVTHDTFVIERTYDASRARVFRAFADPAVKSRWFGGPGFWSDPENVFEFRVGGRERHRAEIKGRMTTFDGVYWDIVPDERIVYAYDMHVEGTRISVSLATVELKPAGTGTRLHFTEQGAFLDGHDTVATRERGTGGLLDALRVELDRQVEDEAGTMG